MTPPTPAPSSFQISHRPSGLSGQHHVDHRPLVPISAPVQYLNPMVKRPRQVPFHISFSLVSGLSSVFVALPCGTPWWLSAAEFPLLWCLESPLIEKRYTVTFISDHLNCFLWSQMEVQVVGRVSMCICICLNINKGVNLRVHLCVLLSWSKSIESEETRGTVSQVLFLLSMLSPWQKRSKSEVSYIHTLTGSGSV